MRKLHVGCGSKYIQGYEHNDMYIDTDFIDYKCHTKDIPVEDETFDEIYARHWIEHLYYHDAVETISVLVKKLKTNGYIHLILPDIEYHAKQLLTQGSSLYKPNSSNFEHAIAGFYGWVIKDKEYMSHKYGYTKESMTKFLNKFNLRIEWIDCRKCDLELKAYKI